MWEEEEEEVVEEYTPVDDGTANQRALNKPTWILIWHRSSLWILLEYFFCTIQTRHQM